MISLAPGVWADPPSQPVLSIGEVQVWRARLDREADFVARMEQTLGKDERSRADRFHFEKDRGHFIVARGVVREILGRYLGCDGGRLKFRAGPYGKPSLDPELGAAARSLRFNTSHSAGLAVCAVMRDRDVGVDVERIRTDFDELVLAERFFSRGEIEALRSVPSPLRKEAFFTCWTRKEAFIKARGEGLSMALDSFDVSLAPGSRARVLATRERALDGKDWSLDALFPGEGFVGALATEEGPYPIHCFQWGSDERLSSNDERAS